MQIQVTSAAEARARLTYCLRQIVLNRLDAGYSRRLGNWKQFSFHRREARHYIREARKLRHLLRQVEA